MAIVWPGSRNLRNADNELIRPMRFHDNPDSSTVPTGSQTSLVNYSVRRRPRLLHYLHAIEGGAGAEAVIEAD